MLGRKQVKKTIRNWIIWYLVMATLVIGIAPKAYASFSPSEVMALSSTERSSDLQKVQQFIELKMVRERLKQYGLTQEEITAKLDGLSDQQIHQLALKVDDLRVAADEGLGIIVVLLVVVILVIIIIMLLGHTVVVK
jgi:hypothetical protein